MLLAFTIGILRTWTLPQACATKEKPVGQPQTARRMPSLQVLAEIARIEAIQGPAFLH
jgi:hypothetical protein